MYEIDVLKVGNEKDADAITARFTRPDTGGMAHVVIDAGWQADGDTVVAMLERYGAPKVDVAIVTHPDGDHIGGMGKVFDRFSVDHLLIHRIDQRGSATLPATKAVQELVAKAERGGTTVTEPKPGLDWAMARSPSCGRVMHTTTSSSPRSWEAPSPRRPPSRFARHSGR